MGHATAEAVVLAALTGFSHNCIHPNSVSTFPKGHATAEAVVRAGLQLVPYQQSLSLDTMTILSLFVIDQMGHATAEAVVRAGLKLVPYTFTGESEGVAVESIGVSGIPVELIAPDARQQAMEKVHPKSKTQDSPICDPLSASPWSSSSPTPGSHGEGKHALMEDDICPACGPRWRAAMFCLKLAVP